MSLQYSPLPTFAQDVTYEGRNAERRTTQQNSLNLGVGKQYTYPVDEVGEGVLLNFTVAANDENIAVDCFIYDEEGRENPITDRTMLQVAMLGRGMTVGEAHAIDDTDTSLDKGGTPSTDYPYLQRYKNTPTGTETEYTIYRGTINDKWIVLTYQPIVKERYSRLYFNVRNTSTEGDRMIHHMSIQRIKFVDLLARPVDEDLTHELEADVVVRPTYAGV